MTDKEFICNWNENIQHIPLLNPDKLLMPPLHIKLEFMKNFVKAMVKHRLNGFEFLSKKFPKLKPSKELLLVHNFEKFLKTQSLKKL